MYPRPPWVPEADGGKRGRCRHVSNYFRNRGRNSDLYGGRASAACDPSGAGDQGHGGRGASDGFAGLPGTHTAPRNRVSRADGEAAPAVIRGGGSAMVDENT